MTPVEKRIRVECDSQDSAKRIFEFLSQKRFTQKGMTWLIDAYEGKISVPFIDVQKMVRGFIEDNV